MGKRSDFARVERDFYPTPYAGVVPLLPHLKAGTKFHEPCYGRGHLADHLEKNGHHCAEWGDISNGIDALSLTECGGACFITNPPWNRKILHPLIEHLSNIVPTWLLFDADWPHTLQARPFMPRLRKIVSVGRLIWIPGTKMTGKDNCAWYLFTEPQNRPTKFDGRMQ